MCTCRLYICTRCISRPTLSTKKARGPEKRKRRSRPRSRRARRRKEVVKTFSRLVNLELGRMAGPLSLSTSLSLCLRTTAYFFSLVDRDTGWRGNSLIFSIFNHSIQITTPRLHSRKHTLTSPTICDRLKH